MHKNNEIDAAHKCPSGTNVTRVKRTHDLGIASRSIFTCHSCIAGQY